MSVNRYSYLRWVRNRFIIIAGISGAITVGIGAMGAHALRGLITTDYMHTYETAVQYQIYHTLALLGAGILTLSNDNKFLKWAGNLFIAGIILFSGSLYFLATRSLIGIEGMGWMGAITPLGGLSFIMGWLFLVISFLNKKYE